MKIRISIFILLVFCVSCGLAQDKVILSNESPVVKINLVSFLQISGDAESISDTLYLYTRKIFQKHNEDIGIYAFGLMETHSREFIYLKEPNSIEVINTTNFDESLIKIGLFIKRNNIEEYGEIKLLIDKIMEVKGRNESRHPSYIEK